VGHHAESGSPAHLVLVKQLFGILRKDAGVLGLEVGSGLAQDAHRRALRPAVLHQEHAHQKGEGLIRGEPHLHAPAGRRTGVEGVSPRWILRSSLAPEGTIGLEQALEADAEVGGRFGAGLLQGGCDRLLDLVALVVLHKNPE
jgi:hypothetical protein